MKPSEAYIGQRVYCGDDGSEFIITGFNEQGADVDNETEKTWIDFDNLFPI